MVAEDRVMNKGQMQEAIIQGRAGVPAYGSGAAEHWQAEYKAVAQAQDKISFKAGVLKGLARSNNPLDSPCVFCGYNGEFYWQRETHSGDCPFFNIAGMSDRQAWLKESLAIKEV